MEPDQTGSSLSQTLAVAASCLCEPSHPTPCVGFLHFNMSYYFPVMVLKLKSSRQSLPPHLLSASKLRRVGLVPSGTALAHKREKLFPSLNLWKSPPPLSSSPLPTCLASSPSAVAKPAPSPKQPRLSPSPLGHPCLWVCPLSSLEAMFISVSPFLFVSHSAAWFIVGDSHA